MSGSYTFICHILSSYVMLTDEGCCFRLKLAELYVCFVRLFRDTGH